MATARRDLEALSAAGIPVYPQAGRRGWQLLGGARTDLSGLTAPEARALFLLLGPASPAAPSARAALRKLLRALPGTFRADAEAAAEAVVVDPAGWGERTRGRPARGALGAGRRGRHLVPGGRHRGRTAHLPGRPDGRAHRRRGGLRATAGPRPAGRVGRGRRRARAAPLAGRGHGRGGRAAGAGAARAVRPALHARPAAARRRTGDRARGGLHAALGRRAAGRLGRDREVARPATVRAELARIGAELTGRYGDGAAAAPG